MGEGEAVGDGFPGRSVLSGSVEGMGVDLVVGLVGSVRSAVRTGGSYGPLSDTDNVIPTSSVASATTGVSTNTRGTRTNGRTHPSKKYHNSTATTTSKAAGIHHGYASIGLTYPPNILHQDRGSAPSPAGGVSLSSLLDPAPALGGPPGGSCGVSSSGIRCVSAAMIRLCSFSSSVRTSSYSLSYATWSDKTSTRASLST